MGRRTSWRTTEQAEQVFLQARRAAAPWHLGVPATAMAGSPNSAEARWDPCHDRSPGSKCDLSPLPGSVLFLGCPFTWVCRNFFGGQTPFLWVQKEARAKPCLLGSSRTNTPLELTHDELAKSQPPKTTTGLIPDGPLGENTAILATWLGSGWIGGLVVSLDFP